MSNDKINVNLNKNEHFIISYELLFYDINSFYYSNKSTGSFCSTIVIIFISYRLNPLTNLTFFIS